MFITMIGVAIQVYYQRPFAILTFQALLIRRENARRAALVLQGIADQPELGDDNPHWQYWL